MKTWIAFWRSWISNDDSSAWMGLDPDGSGVTSWSSIFFCPSRFTWPNQASQKVFTPNPQRAALYGLIPGGGQVYNRRYWKLPIVYGALGGLYYYASINQTEYRRFKTAYQRELLGEDHEFSHLNLPASVLQNIRNDYRKTMEEGYIFMSLVYLLSIAEAMWMPTSAISILMKTSVVTSGQPGWLAKI